MTSLKFFPLFFRPEIPGLAAGRSRPRGGVWGLLGGVFQSAGGLRASGSGGEELGKAGAGWCQQGEAAAGEAGKAQAERPLQLRARRGRATCAWPMYDAAFIESRDYNVKTKTKSRNESGGPRAYN